MITLPICNILSYCRLLFFFLIFSGFQNLAVSDKVSCLIKFCPPPKLYRLDMFHWNRCVAWLKVTVHSGQEMVYKNQSKGIIQKRNKVELQFGCTALWVINRNMHTRFGMIWTYSDKVSVVSPPNQLSLTTNQWSPISPQVTKYLSQWIQNES